MIASTLYVSTNINLYFIKVAEMPKMEPIFPMIEANSESTSALTQLAGN